ncbi:MAG: hypothetical protein K8I02_01265 [Candidatus Methylomirabilis sp.]|nr:hypothetical protein [Deltaproteobacteria bacterium]
MGTVTFVLVRWALGIDGAPTDYQWLPLLVSLDSIAASLLLLAGRGKKGA